MAVLLAATINQVRRGDLDPKVANTVGYLAGMLLKALDAGALEDRLLALERVVLPPVRAVGIFDAASSDVESRNLLSFDTDVAP